MLFSSENFSVLSKMDIQHVSRDPKSSFTLLTTRQESPAVPFRSPASTNNGPVRTRHNNRTTIVENRSYPQPSRLLWSLPHKRSNQSSTSGRFGDPEEFSPRAFSGIYSAKRLKGPATPPLSNSISSCNDVITTGFSRPLLDLSEAKTLLPERVAYAKAIDDRFESDRPKILRSPFEYTQDLVTSRITATATTDNQRTDPWPRSLRKSTASWGLRHEAQRHAEDYNTESRSDSTLNASTTRPYLSEPVRSKPRVWLDLPEQKHEIQEAVSIAVL